MIRIYITPFNDLGAFGDEIDVTPDVDTGSLGKIKMSLDNSEYDIGILKVGSLSLKLQNWHGKYSDVGNYRSIFKTTRSGSKVRVTWAPAEPAICGLAVCGESVLSEEVSIFDGILNDESAKMNVGDQITNLIALSIDSQFDKIDVPYSALEVGDDLSTILFKILNQKAVTDYAAVAAENIQPQINYLPDDLTAFEDSTGTEAIRKILAAANSIVYVEDGVVRVRGRAPDAGIAMNFFGQASEIGNENIVDISDYRNGQNRIINFLRGKQRDSDLPDVVRRHRYSIDKWGTRLKELNLDFISDPAKYMQSMISIIREFCDPKVEFTLTTFLSAGSTKLRFLSKVNLDCPPQFVVEAKSPSVNHTVIGEVNAPLPYPLWSFEIFPESEFKIMALEVDLKKELISFDVRGV